MIGEEILINIMRVADLTDDEDIAIRRMLVTALRESDVDFTGLMQHGLPERDDDHSPPISPPTG